MRLTIFSKLVIGYIVIFMITIVMIVYINMQFNRLGKITNSIVSVHNRITNQNKKMIELLLTLVNYEKKYVIMKDKELYGLFLGTRNDFEKTLREMKTIAGEEEFKKPLELISRSYQSYLDVFEKEAEFLKTGSRYPQALYAGEKEKAVADMITGLRELRNQNENSIYEKLVRLEKTDINARKVVLLVTVLSVVCCIILSIIITRSITGPLAVMRKKTKEIAGGHYRGGDMRISSSSEIDELVQDFNMMCHKLRETDKIKTDFFAFMSHELRTPVTSIREGTNLLLDGIGGEASEKQKRILRIIAAESNRLIDLINTIMDLSKMEAGMMQYHFVQSDIAPLLQRAIIEIEPLAKSKNIRTELRIEDNIPPIRMDIDKILQALRNLLGNAVKYSPEGGLVRVFARSNNSHLEVAVADEGPGIPRENLGSVFDKFRSTHKGTGLGLAIVKSIIRSHGGKVWAEKNSGQGSTFVFLLPA